MAEAKLIDGKGFAERLVARIRAHTERIKAAHGITPGLATVLVGDDPASQIYVRNKGRRVDAAGINSFQHTLPALASQDELLELVGRLNGDAAVHGIMVQLPLPDHIDAEVVIQAVDPAKDVDGFHPMNAGRLFTGRDGLRPCTPVGCMMLIEDALDALAGRDDLAGRDALVVGRSNIVGKPMAMLLLAAHCTVTIAHSRTRNLADACRRADILVAAVGCAGMIRGDWIKPGAVVIDVGINRIEGAEGKTRLVGDVEFEAARKVAGAITPVPGGVGPMTIACLLQNTLAASCRQHGIEPPEVASK